VKKILMLAMVLGLLFLAVGKTNAEGAWVLWQKAAFAKNNNPNSWILEGAFTTYAICIQAEASTCKQAASSLGNESDCKSRSGQHFIFIFDTKLNRSGEIIWMCLPESVDPRK